MKDDKHKYGPYNYQNWMEWAQGELFDSFETTIEAYDYLVDYSKVFNFYQARTAQPNPFSNKAMFIIDTLNSLGVKSTIDIFNYDGSKLVWGNDEGNHKLVNIIAEPNPQATGPAILFCAHHDVVNLRSENCQDNGASICNLLRLASLIQNSKESHQRVIILFSDCEEFGARGARKFAKNSERIKGSANIKHKIYGEISGVVNLELTGLGEVIWSDCKMDKEDSALHLKLEKTFENSIIKLTTPPSDVIVFREYDFPALCIGILPEKELENKNTWRLCHSMEDTLTKCNRKNMEDFTNFLFNLTKNQQKDTEHGTTGANNETAGNLPT